MLRIIAEPVQARQLEAGDLFSSLGDEYWNDRDPEAIGEKIYIRTDAPLTHEQAIEDVYRVHIRKED